MQIFPTIIVQRHSVTSFETARSLAMVALEESVGGA